MIPKVIHYVWFGGSKNKITVQAINTWKKKAPDYKIIEWNENTIPSINNVFFLKAMEHKDYAFASDYVRLYVLERFGGIYLDTDMYLLRSPNKILEKKELVFGIQDEDIIFSTSFIAAEAHNSFIKQALQQYKDLKYMKGEMKPNTFMLSKLAFKTFGLKHADVTQEVDHGNVVAYSSAYLLQPSFRAITLHVGTKSWADHTRHDDIRIKLRQRISNSIEAGIFRVLNDAGRKIIR